MNKKLLLQILALLLYSQSVYSFDGLEVDSEYWQYFTHDFLKSGPYRTYMVNEIRWNERMSNYSHFRLSANFAYETRAPLDLEVHVSAVYTKPAGSKHFTNYARLEFEFNPYISFENGTMIRFRNRLELEKRSLVKYIVFVFRQRTLISFPIKNQGVLVGMNIYNEFFYHFDSDQITQNRFFPVELVFALNEKYQLSVFTMIRQVLRNNDWHRSLVFGTNLQF